MGAKVKEWVNQVNHLAKIAISQPHAAYTAFTHGLLGSWTYLLRTVPDVGPLLQPLEEAIHQIFLPALTGRAPCCPMERELLSLPTCLGGLGIIDPSKTAGSEFATSTKLSAPLTALIVAQECCYSVDLDEQRKVKAEARASKRSSQCRN